MKLHKLAVSLLALGLLSSSAAFARESNKTTLNLYEKVTVNGKTLNPGTYTVDWQGSGSNVQVNILQGKHTVATTSAHAEEQPAANTSSAYGSSTQPDGSRALTTIFVGGKHTALQLDQTQAAQSSNTSSTAK
jgi:hypothetical protein